jgi:hypothetical protein
MLLRALAMHLVLCGSLYAQSYEGLISGAKTAAANGRYTEAADQARRAISLDGTRWEAYAIAGVAYAKLSDCGSANNYLRDALSRAPEAQKGAVQEAINGCRATSTPPTLVPPAQDSSGSGNQLPGSEWEFSWSVLGNEPQRQPNLRLKDGGRCELISRAQPCEWKQSGSSVVINLKKTKDWLAIRLNLTVTGKGMSGTSEILGSGAYVFANGGIYDASLRRVN